MSSRIVRGDQANVRPTGRDRPGGQPSAVRKGVIDAEVYDATQRAREIIDDAEQEAGRVRSEAEAVLAQAQQDAEQMRAQAQQEREHERRSGLEQGREEGMAQALELLTAAREERDRLLRQAEGDILKLAIGVAGKIIGRQVETDRSAIVDIVSQAIQSVRHQKEIVIRVHPDDLSALEEKRPKLMGLLSRAQDLSLRGDPEIERGGCIIDSEIGTIDARLSTQLETLKKILLRRRT